MLGSDTETAALLYNLICCAGDNVSSSDFHQMNEQAQACLRKAEECDAQRTKDASVRLLYLDLANHWRTLAERVEAMDRQRARFEQSEPKSEGT